MLECYGAQATFFVIGRRVGRHAELLRRVVAAGHIVGNHSWDHTRLTALGTPEIETQLERTNAALAEVLGRPPTLFRPPFGDRDERVDAVATRFGLTTVMWDVDCEDWKRPGVDTIARAVACARAGAIVLLHDGGDGDRAQTVAGLELGLARALSGTAVG